MHETKIGPLNCWVQGDPETAKILAVFAHGFGAPGTDLVALGEELFQIDDELVGQVAFVFPAAPLSLEHMGMPGGRAWWEINMMRLQQMLETNRIEELVNTEPPGLREARELYLDFLGALCREANKEFHQLVLGGFSQGAMLSTDLFMRHSATPAGLCLFSGTTICLNEWRELVVGKPGLPIFQSHGRQDQILPFEAALILRDLLNASGQEVEFLPFNGPHTIPYEALNQTAALLKGLASS
ncbi:alpha/beta hydrolase [Rubinisphaera margarita]|uniref:alpha/beta hydrolase n=1 Tax=Rubinisphaera margarita TaxID=2909586 RepID=UPI001EE83313|nr:hypothetical protein [Rubinisphaera margarita]MCG6156177.1 hypothetical protein [Rubinisphaera margarita]